MLSKKRILKLVALTVVLWLVVTLNIRFRPEAIRDPIRGLIPLITAPLAG